LHQGNRVFAIYNYIFAAKKMRAAADAADVLAAFFS